MVRFEEYVGKDAKLTVKLGDNILFFDANSISIDENWIMFTDRFGNKCTFKKDFVLELREI